MHRRQHEECRRFAVVVAKQEARAQREQHERQRRIQPQHAPALVAHGATSGLVAFPIVWLALTALLYWRTRVTRRQHHRF